MLEYIRIKKQHSKIKSCPRHCIHREKHRMKHRTMILRAIAVILAVSMVLTNETALCGVVYAAHSVSHDSAPKPLGGGKSR